MKHLFLSILLFVGLFSQTALAQDPETGWWWNADEPGRGFSLEQQGETIFFAAYQYDDSGSPTWLTAALTKEGERGFRGKLTEFANGQTLLGAFQPHELVNDNVGEITLVFSDDDKGTMTWPGGTVPITRFRFAADDSSPDNDNGLLPVDPTAIAKGSILFAVNCSNSTCHGTDPGLNQNRILSGKKPDTIRSAFKNVQRMIDAGVSDRVSDEEVESIAAYLDSIQ